MVRYQLASYVFIFLGSLFRANSSALQKERSVGRTDQHNADMIGEGQRKEFLLSCQKKRYTPRICEDNPRRNNYD